LTPNGELRLGEQSRELVVDSEQPPPAAAAAGAVDEDVVQDDTLSPATGIERCSWAEKRPPGPARPATFTHTSHMARAAESTRVLLEK